MSSAKKGGAVVYVIRLRRRLCHARHYVGWTVDLEQRIRQHLTGHGSALLNAANAYGIGWDVVHVIPCRSRRQAWQLERHIKRGHVRRWCPVEQRRRGRPTVSFRPGRTADTRRTVAAALGSVPPAVRALTAGPSALTPRAVPFARRAFDTARAARLAQAPAGASPFVALA